MMSETQRKNNQSAHNEQPKMNGAEAEAERGQEDQTRSKYEELQSQCDQLLDKYQRAAAELQNYQKRAARQRVELIQRTKVDTIEQFLFPVIDDLDRAIEAANNHGYDQDDPIFAGLTMVHQRMLEVLKQYAIEPMDPLGKPFDPLYHQAVMEQPSDVLSEGAILQVLSRGYTAEGKTIRPARVVVAKKNDQSDQTEESSDQGQES